MGDWNISIQGAGAHHNRRNPQDANRMAAEFVQRLRDAGHTVHSGIFTCGGVDFVGEGRGYLDNRDHLEKP